MSPTDDETAPMRGVLHRHAVSPSPKDDEGRPIGGVLHRRASLARSEGKRRRFPPGIASSGVPGP